MRRCPYCNVGIEGDLLKCPLCQSKLSGTGEDPCYPKFEAQKKRSLFYKIQLFLAWGLLIVGVGLDFMVGLRLPGYPGLHWSLLLAMWLMGLEFGIMRQFKPDHAGDSDQQQDHADADHDCDVVCDRILPRLYEDHDRSCSPECTGSDDHSEFCFGDDR